MNCTIPDMKSGIPTEPEDDIQRPLCSTSEQFQNYTKWFEHIGFISEGGIYEETGCMPKCKEDENECISI